jgi:hypothetical protein
LGGLEKKHHCHFYTFPISALWPREVVDRSIAAYVQCGRSALLHMDGGLSGHSVGMR